MARIPRLSEKVVDLVIRALRTSGVLATDESADAIRAANNNATEAELDAIAASLSYGGVGGGAGGISSTDNLYFFADSNDTVNNNTTYFIYGIDQPEAPITDVENEVMSITAHASTVGPVLRLGQRPTLVPTIARSSKLLIGTDPSTSLGAYAELEAGPFEVNGGPGFRVRAPTGVALQFETPEELRLRTSQFTGDTFGGWTGLSSPFTMAFHLGDYENNDSLAIEQLDDTDFPGVVKHYQIRPTNNTNTPGIYIRGSFTDDVIRVIIGGREGTDLDSKSVGAPIDATVLIATPEIDPSITALYVKHTNDTPGLNADILVIEAERAQAQFRYIEARNTDVGDLDGPVKFYVDGLGQCRSDGGFNTPAADVAEWVQVVGAATDYAYGDVLVVDSATGKMMKSASSEDAKVVGVVADPDGVSLLMGQGKGFDESGAVALSATTTNIAGKTYDLTFSGDLTSELDGVPHVRARGEFYGVAGVAFDAASSITTLSLDPAGRPVTVPRAPVTVYKGIVQDTDRLAMTVLGIVPVKVITTNGTINRGDALVSAGGARATTPAGALAAGTLLGKALDGLTDDGSGTVTGTIRALISLG